ncbi:hypothetical protein HDZ31DRAFT_62476 [Schizophyllum fasciatum]
MRTAALLALLLAAGASPACAAPAADAAQHYTVTTQTDSGCVYYASGTHTRTATQPGRTATVADARTTTTRVTEYVYPTAAAERAVAATTTDDEWTISVSVVCASTRTVDPVVTTQDPAVVTTTTAFASTETQVETYTLCVEGHVCG